jgi:hypothetical protein
MTWIWVIGHVLFHTDSSFLSFKAAGMSKRTSLIITISISSAAIGFLCVGNSLAMHLFHHIVIIDHISYDLIEKLGYIGVAILSLIPGVPFAKEAGLFTAQFFGLDYAPYVVLFFNAVRIIFISKLFF